MSQVLILNLTNFFMTKKIIFFEIFLVVPSTTSTTSSYATVLITKRQSSLMGKNKFVIAIWAGVSSFPARQLNACYVGYFEPKETFSLRIKTSDF